MKKFVNLYGMLPESLVNGVGLRRVFFAQGCKHNCKGCFSPESHDMNSGKVFDVDDLVKDVLENPMLKGVTFSGGDPFFQSESFAYMAYELKKSVKRFYLKIK